MSYYSDGEREAQSLREALDSAISEIERLQANIDRLPRDADGNPIFPLDVRYRKSGFKVVVWKIGVEYVFGSDGSVHEPKSLYGSPEAAEKARVGK